MGRIVAKWIAQSLQFTPIQSNFGGILQALSRIHAVRQKNFNAKALRYEDAKRNLSSVIRPTKKW
jgi:hypothetical protein